MNLHWYDKDVLLPVIKSKILKVDIVLDIGCGIMPQKCIRPMVHICCEPYDQYVAYLQKKIRNEYDRNYVIIHASWKEAIRLFPPMSVDTVFLTDVIEHLEKEEASKLLHDTEKIARRQIIIFTPLGYMPQTHHDRKDAWGLDGAQWQEHKSGWQPEDFDDTWDVYATEKFHETDSFGKKFEAPYGAFWAIKNIEYSAIDMNSALTKANLSAISDLAVELRLNILLKIVIGLMKILVKIKRSRFSVFLYRIFTER